MSLLDHEIDKFVDLIKPSRINLPEFLRYAVEPCLHLDAAFTSRTINVTKTLDVARWRR
jgi:hypothetical protein